jgi:hypothetical protein|tara:strand:- start:1055 stop:2035 length:981 start_codon:yes stop_codon:yes gene_type:complete
MGTCKSQGFFQYATVYSSFTMSTSTIETQDYIAVNKGYEETTQINPFDINATIGIRKIARFDFEAKRQVWYYGDEKSVSDYTTLSRFNGWEYLFNYSFIRNQSETFTNSDFWLRYVSDKFIAKAQIKNDDMRDLSFSSLDLRYRINKGGLDLSFGGCGRKHDVYHLNPIEDVWSNGENTFQDLANDFGYSTQYVQGQWYWFKDGDLLATSNDEFFKHYFGSAIAEYNQNFLDDLGRVNELSLVMGLSYYYYKDNYWLLTWVNILPIHYGLSEYSHQYAGTPIDLDLGLVAGLKITKSLGFFVETNYMRFWEKDIYECKFGFNYLIF